MWIKYDIYVIERKEHIFSFFFLLLGGGGGVVVYVSLKHRSLKELATFCTQKALINTKELLVTLTGLSRIGLMGIGTRASIH